MKKYQIQIQGKNFLVSQDGEKKTMGFYTTRWVEAFSPEEAETVAIELIKNDQELRETIINGKDNPPMLYAEKISEIHNFEGVDPPGSGYTFFPDE
ncbi:MAG: hypothetical protein KQH63_16265 [Desulfobulbaceae bacterium]|nr:hypothetical protein [Desulfobulbaceae bacterium]